MRVLMATTAGSGHFGPMIPFGDACRRAGHEVLVAAPRSFERAVHRAGYECWPCADIAPEALAEVQSEVKNDIAGEYADLAPEQRPLGGLRMFFDLAPRALLPGLLAAIDEWRPDVLLREVGEFGSAVAAELRSLPHMQVNVGLDGVAEVMLPVGAPLLGAIRESVGLAPDPTGERLRGLPTLSLLPASYEQTVSSTVHRYRDGSTQAPAPLPAWWPNESDPLVYVSFGSVAGSLADAQRAFRTVVEAIADLPVRLLITVGEGGDPAEWSSLPPSAHLERWVPQRAAMAEAAAVVCHGGMGTVLGALSAGLPLLVVPQFADQPGNAARVEALGAGVRVGEDMSTPPDPGAVRDALTRVLTDATLRAGARRLAEEIAALPPADEAVALLTG